jgi:hypothetical protein
MLILNPTIKKCNENDDQIIKHIQTPRKDDIMYLTN